MTVILLILVFANAAWLLVSPFRGPLFAVVFYSFVLYLCLRKGDYRAPLVAGLLAFAFHALEWFLGSGPGGRGDAIFFMINLILPLSLVYFSYKAVGRNRGG